MLSMNICPWFAARLQSLWRIRTAAR
jgi:hypothetical protein